MDHTSEADIALLVQQFEAKSLSKEMWTHQAHMMVALWYLYRHGYHESLCLMRSKIIEYNCAIGTINSPFSGYHETLTIFWLKVIYRHTTLHKTKTLPDVCNSFLISGHAMKELPLQYYTRAKLFSTQARAEWVMPDKPIDL
jgi:hypothetical protein